MALLTSINLVSAKEKNAYNGRYIFLISTITALGGLLFGYDIANISGTIHFFTIYFQLDDVNVGWAVGCLSLGAAIGALVSGKLSDLYGRKKILLISSVLFAITGVGTGWAETFSLFIISRILSGVAIGCATVVCPIYIAEMAPAALRGKLVAYYQLAITLGVMLAFLSNYLLLDTGDNNWRYMFSSQSVPAILFFCGLLFVMESPRWLIMNNREPEARILLKRIGGDEYAENEILSIHGGLSSQTNEKVPKFSDKKIVYILVTGIGMAVFSQMGVPITAYAPEIFKAAGVAEGSAFQQSIIVGAILFLFTLVAILTVEKAGRRSLLLYGTVLLLFDTIAIALAFHFHMAGIWVLVFALVFNAVYAATVGPVSWVVLSEIFPNRFRGYAMSIATLSLWITNFLNTASFPVLKSNFGMAAAAGAYVPVFVLFILFVYIRIPETKGKSLEEIEKTLTKRK